MNGKIICNFVPDNIGSVIKFASIDLHLLVIFEKGKERV
jgi:hypothetical protein